MESILTSIKKLLGIAEDYDHFDVDLIIHINTVLMGLTQMGVGPTEGYMITSSFNTWDQFIDEDKNLAAVKSYVYLKVKLLFDPPLGSAHIETINRAISELEWRLNIEAESASSV